MRHPRAHITTALLVACAAAAAIAAAVAVAGCGNSQAPAPADDARSQIARLQRTTEHQQRLIELAGGKSFYLVLDPAASDLTLMLSGAELQRYPVLGLQVGRPRVGWISRRDARPWQDVIWSRGELDPQRQIDRLVVQAAPAGKDEAEAEAPQIPPTPEELYPVPSRYHVRFDEGRSIEIRPLDADKDAGRLARLRAWLATGWHDAVAAAFESDRDAVRIRIALNPKDAASLYRSLPPAVKLIILSKDSQPASSATPRPAASPVPAAGKSGS